MICFADLNSGDPGCKSNCLQLVHAEEILGLLPSIKANKEVTIVGGIGDSAQF